MRKASDQPLPRRGAGNLRPQSEAIASHDARPIPHPRPPLHSPSAAPGLPASAAVGATFLFDGTPAGFWEDYVARGGLFDVWSSQVR